MKSDRHVGFLRVQIFSLIRVTYGSAQAECACSTRFPSSVFYSSDIYVCVLNDVLGIISYNLRLDIVSSIILFSMRMPTWNTKTMDQDAQVPKINKKLATSFIYY